MDVISQLLGVPEDDEEQLRTWTNALLDRDEGVPDVTPDGIDAATHLYKYFCDFVADRRARSCRGHAPTISRRRCARPGPTAPTLARRRRSSGSSSC